MNELITFLEEDLRNICYNIKLKGREILSNYDITTPQFEVLLVLRRHELITVGMLRKLTYISSSTLTDLLDKMEISGLISRQKDEKDRRIIRVSLDQKGKAVIQSVLDARVNFMQTLFSDDFDELEKYYKNISELRKRVEAVIESNK